MSLKRSHSIGKSFGGGGESGGKIDRQDLFDELKKLSGSGEAFTPVDVALAIGASEPQVSKALLGLAAEGYLEKAELGRYRAGPLSELTQAEFVKAYARASRVDSTRQRDLTEISRLKQNNDTMRQRLLTAIAERDHYLAALQRHGIDPGPAPVPSAAAAGESASGTASGGSGPSTAPSTAAKSSPAQSPRRHDEQSSESPPGPDGLAVPSPESERAPSGPGDDTSSH